ncbi:MAG: flippase-like domain-containing protein [Proteobacteria bacterium]|nr:flippase-like domain-containing protein [Pseudomonadota bacterium]
MTSTHSRKSWLPGIRRAAQASWVVLIILFMSWYFHRHWTDFAQYSWSLDPWWALPALFFALVRRLLAGLRWPIIAFLDAGKIPLPLFWDHMRVFFLSNLASYLPGTVWYMASRIQQSKKRGHSILRTSVGLVFETGLLLWFGMMVGILTLDRLIPFPREVLVAGSVLMIVISLVVTHPKVAQAILRLLMRLLRQPVQPVHIRWSLGLTMWLLSLGIYVAWGLCLFCLLKALGATVTIGRLLDITSLFALSWVIGFLTPWAPSGLGIREGLLYVMLQGIAAPPMAMVAAVATRIITILEDVFWAAVSLLIGSPTPVTPPPKE